MLEVKNLYLVLVLVIIFLPFHYRLSYHQRIVDIVPESFSALIPAKPATVYKFGGEAGSGKSAEG